MIFRTVCTMTVLLLTAQPVLAATFYVAEHGSAGNPGTKLSPFGTIQQASERAQPGDTVLVMPGMYRERITTRANGVTYRSEQMWKARLEIHTDDHMWVNWGDHVTIAGFEITGEGRNGILNYGSYGTIAGNHVHHIGTSCRLNVGAGIDASANSGGTGNSTVGNFVHHIAYGCPKREGYAAAHSIYHAYGNGLMANNIVLFVQGFGLHLWHEPRGTRVYNNVSCRNTHGIVVGGDPKRHQFADDIEVANNIFCENAAYGIREEGQRRRVRYGPNIEWGNPAGIEDLPGGATFEQVLHVNPKFRDPGQMDYRLLSDSHARDRGIDAPGVTVDFAGWPRPEGAAYDIGAYEYGGPQWPAEPPSPGDPTSPPMIGPLPPPTNFRLLMK